MKFTIVAVSVALCFLTISALPLDELPDEIPVQQNVPHYRVRRVTCDVLSGEGFGIKLNHSACAAHCIALGRAGGYCTSIGVCNCRR